MSKSSIFLVLVLCVLAQGNVIKNDESTLPCLDENALGIPADQLSVSKTIMKCFHIFVVFFFALTETF